MAWLDVEKIKSSLLWIDGRVPAGSGAPEMLPAGSTVFLLVLCVLQFLCLKGMEIEEEKNAAGAVAHGIFGQCRVILSGEAFYSCSRALLPCHRSEIRNTLEISFELCLGREKRSIVMHWTTSNPSWLPWCSLAKWVCLMPAVVFPTCFVFSTLTCLIPQIILQQTFLSLQWP